MPRFSRTLLPAVHQRRRFLGQCAGWAMLGSALAACDRTPSALTAGDASFRGIDITGASYARDFSLTDFQGVPRHLADYRGKVVMLYFGFVQCPDVCPTALTRAAAVKQRLGAEGSQLQVLFVTVDPERDTPALLREYMAAFDSSFVALTGLPAQIKAAADEFRVFYKKVPTGSSYTMDHTALSYLFDRKGHIRVALRHEQTVDDYTADVKALLAERRT